MQHPKPYDADPVVRELLELRDRHLLSIWLDAQTSLRDRWPKSVAPSPGVRRPRPS
jgi:hypothetical protein